MSRMMSGTVDSHVSRILTYPVWPNPKAHLEHCEKIQQQIQLHTLTTKEMAVPIQLVNTVLGFLCLLERVVRPF